MGNTRSLCFGFTVKGLRSCKCKRFDLTSLYIHSIESEEDSYYFTSEGFRPIVNTLSIVISLFF